MVENNNNIYKDVQSSNYTGVDMRFKLSVAHSYCIAKVVLFIEDSMLGYYLTKLDFTDYLTLVPIYNTLSIYNITSATKYLSFTNKDIILSVVDENENVT